MMASRFPCSGGQEIFEAAHDDRVLRQRTNGALDELPVRGVQDETAPLLRVLVHHRPDQTQRRPLVREAPNDPRAPLDLLEAASSPFEVRSRFQCLGGNRKNVRQSARSLPTVSTALG